MAEGAEMTTSALEQVKKMLDEMKKLGMRVPAGAYAVAERDAEKMRANGMKVCEIADHCVESC